MVEDNAEIIEKLARELERQCLLMRLEECRTLEDFENAVAELKASCKSD